MTLVLLPGLDGTGELFAPFIRALPDDIGVQVIPYDLHIKQTYDELSKYVLSKLPEDEFVLLAESFSGPIAYKIALSKPKQLKSLILVATFLENPRPILLKLIPSSKKLAFPIPTIFIKLFFLGFSVPKETIQLVKQTIKRVSPNVLAFRLQEISQLKPCDQKLGLRTTYIQASNDKLVPSSLLKNWQNVCSELNIFQVHGEHFILQANAATCAEIVTEEIHLAM